MQLFREIREELIWADGGAVKKATDAAILSMLGPKTEADLQAGKKKPAKKVSRYTCICTFGPCRIPNVECFMVVQGHDHTQ